jgi:hypothetical protein
VDEGFRGLGKTSHQSRCALVVYIPTLGNPEHVRKDGMLVTSGISMKLCQSWAAKRGICHG